MAWHEAKSLESCRVAESFVGTITRLTLYWEGCEVRHGNKCNAAVTRWDMPFNARPRLCWKNTNYTLFDMGRKWKFDIDVTWGKIEHRGRQRLEWTDACRLSEEKQKRWFQNCRFGAILDRQADKTRIYSRKAEWYSLQKNVSTVNQ